MKFYVTILLMLSLSWMNVYAAAPAKTAQTQQQQEIADVQQKMAQLQQVLQQAGQGGGAPLAAKGGAATPITPQATAPAVTTAPAVQAAPAQAISMQAPSAGLISAPAAVAQQGDAAQPQAVATAAATTAAPSPTVAAQPQPVSPYDQAFSNVVNQLLPMTPDQISKLREVFTESQLAAATPPGVPPKPTTTSLLINLSPQATAPVIRLGAGYITSLVFMDATGQPWPIAAYSIGDSTSFNIQWDHKGNTLLVQASAFYKRTNMAIILRDLNTPVMLTLIAGQEAVDYRVDLRVPGLGPNAVYTQGGLPDSTNPILLDVLNGVAPKSSKELKVNGGDCQAWLVNNKLFLRTSLDVLSPAWQSVMSSIDGTHAYQLQPAPVILALQHGKDKMLKLTLEGIE